ncbi:hypothetical protein SteCoe_23465 [Stentor coeruleus]|uniref:Retinoblastoma-associated protein A-box domain-containing protein n=1 Tax=Stentor coeruleus TaxID=5963 RepID=A0A1R2BJT3_9CILI|nr:hypothetical protein SteCoe_23465 [Stentor coeruleus]
MTEASRFHLWDNLRELTIDESIKQPSEDLFFKIKDSEGQIDENKSLILMRCCTLIISKSITMQTIDGLEIKGSHINISSYLKGTPSDLNTYLGYLEKLIPHISDHIGIMVKEIIRKIEISTIMYKKFKEIWDKADIRGNDEFLTGMIQLLWLFVINIKSLLKINSIFESGYLIIAVYKIALNTIDPELVGFSQPFIVDLCGIMKASIEKTKTWADSVDTLLQDFLQKGQLCSKNGLIPGIFAGSVLNKNISLLSHMYQSSLTQDDFDERDLILTKQKIRTPQKPKCIRVSKPHEIVGKVLRWDEQTNEPSIASKLHDVTLPPASPFIPPPTPMTMTMELNNWFVDLLDSITDPETLLQQSVPAYLYKGLVLRRNDMLEATKKIFVQRNIGTKSALGMMFINDNFEMHENPKQNDLVLNKNSRIDELEKFFTIVIGRIFTKELEKGLNSENLAKNEDFNRGIFACCLEALLYLHSVVSINFEEVLDISGSTPFDLWRVVNAFLQFDCNIPQSLRRHYRDIEIKIISHLAWREGSKINQAIKVLINRNQESSETSLFLRRVLSHSANRILELSNCLGLTEVVKEEIWSVFKDLLSEKTEILVNRHIDHMIVCTIYGVCKIHGNVSFKQIIEKYRQLYFEEPNFFKKVFINDQNNEDIIVFYNLEYIRHMKEIIIRKGSFAKPRIDILHPASPLRSCVPTQMISSGVISSIMKSPIKSPFRTPRSEALWAPCETFANVPKFVSQKINFDSGQPIKKSKIIVDLLQVSKEDIGPAPSLKRDNSTN